MQVQGADFETLLKMQRVREQGRKDSKKAGQSPQQVDVVAALLESYGSSGLQASKFAEAQRLLTQALSAKEAEKKTNQLNPNATGKKKTTTKKIYLAYTSNLISSGLREVFAVMVKSGHCDGIITTAGGIEEDYIKCLGPTMLGDFALPGVALREKGLNRVGNLLIPNNNYVEFDDFMTPTLSEIHNKQKESDWEECTGPSDIIQEIGLSLQRYSEKRAVDIVEQQQERRSQPKVGEEEGESESEAPLRAIDTTYSVGYWSSQEHVPVFCPALTDGSIGDMMFFFNFRRPGMIVDPLVDVAKLHAHVATSFSADTGVCGDDETEEEITMLILGGGLPKHHLMRAVKEALKNRDSTDNTKIILRTVNISTALNTDGSVSAPSEVEDAACGLVSAPSSSASETVRMERVSMHADATLVFPLLYASAVKTVLAEAQGK